ncbi:facilitated trehalose transporter Tret1-like [Periplaneta americana]|uniref:facilitated trehalose transporter Tret1-like n=1 Tax=Periplaneta americana TaxID=6978 RepID=UPI0037E7B724
MTKRKFSLGNRAVISSLSHEPSAFRRRLPQILANGAANLLVLDLCMAIAYTTVLIAATLDAKEDLSIDEEQASWLGSIAFICQPIGSLISGLIVEFFGRRWSMILVNIPFLAGWLLYSFANSVEMLFVANITLGVGIGFMEAPIMTYLGETCQPEIRAIITSTPGVTCQISVFLVFLMGNLTDWRSVAGISAVMPIITVLYVLLMPETPIWLLSRGRYEDAERALCWLRGWVTPDLVREEFNQLISYSNAVNKTQLPFRGISTLDTVLTKPEAEKGLENKAFEGDSDSKGTQQMTVQQSTANDFQEAGEEPHCSPKRWKEMLKPATLRPLLVVNPCFFLLHWGGLSSIKPYMVHVFQEFGLGEAASWTTVGSGVTSVAGGACLFILVNWVSKRKLSMVAMAGSALCCLVVAIYSYVVLGPGGAKDSEQAWVPLSMVVMLAFFNSLFFYIPWNLLCEVFPFRTRGMASGFSAAMCYVFLFAASKTYLDMESSMQLYGVFLFFTAVNILGFIFVYFRVPITEGKSLEEIEKYFAEGG